MKANLIGNDGHLCDDYIGAGWKAHPMRAHILSLKSLSKDPLRLPVNQKEYQFNMKFVQYFATIFLFST